MALADPLVSIEEYEDATGRELSGDEAAQVETLLRHASALVRNHVRPRLDEVTYESADRPDALVPIVVAMVRRGVANPLGRVQESLGDHSYSMGDSGVATLYMTKREQTIVRRAVGQPGIGMIDLAGDLPLQPSEPWP